METNEASRNCFFSDWMVSVPPRENTVYEDIRHVCTKHLEAMKNDVFVCDFQKKKIHAFVRDQFINYFLCITLSKVTMVKGKRVIHSSKKKTAQTCNIENLQV
jgi:hypothetical protein